MVDGEGARVWGASISVYGELRALEGARQACPFRWPGQYEDLETGLYYNRFRYYDAEAGQYTSQDPIRLAADELNLYSYVDDPNFGIDPNGLSFGSGMGQHTAIVNVFDERGNRVHREVLKSGNMTPAEKALGFTQSTLATHTEARATKQVPLSRGQRMEVIGQYPPCSSCKGKMNTRAAATGAQIEYVWKDASTGKTKRWKASGGCKK